MGGRDVFSEVKGVMLTIHLHLVLRL
jgi:hypothetical protein